MLKSKDLFPEYVPGIFSGPTMWLIAPLQQQLLLSLGKKFLRTQLVLISTIP